MTNSISSYIAPCFDLGRQGLGEFLVVVELNPVGGMHSAKTRPIDVVRDEELKDVFGWHRKAVHHGPEQKLISTELNEAEKKTFHAASQVTCS